MCKKLPVQCGPGRYEGSQSDCILLTANGDIEAINAWSPNVHTNLHTKPYLPTVGKVDGAQKKNGWCTVTIIPVPNKKPLYVFKKIIVKNICLSYFSAMNFFLLS